jgi:quercetin dioxygenase-like cupin family protein
MFKLNPMPIAAVAIMMAGVAIAPAAASPGEGVITPENFVTGTLPGDVQMNSDRVKFQTKDDTAVRVQKLTFSAGSRTGWHHHPGVVIVSVQSGTLRLKHSDCMVHEYGPGDVFVEGEARVHEASTVGGAVIFGTYISSSVNPLVFRVEDDVPFCAQPH